MARNEEKFNYAATVKKLKENGPEKLYFLYGPEDYLRDRFVDELRKICLDDGMEGFNYHRMDGASLDFRALKDSVDAIPFMSERSLTELRSFDVNACKAEVDILAFEKVISDLADTSCLCLVMDSDYEPDMRLKLMKAVKKYGEVIKFTASDKSSLLPWIRRRFAACDKNISREAAEHLLFTSGDMMSSLIQEIEKIASAVVEEDIEVRHIDKYANRLPESRVFDMVDAMSDGDYTKAAVLLSDLEATDEEPIKIMFIIGTQFRRLYGMRVAIDEGLGMDFVKSNYEIKHDFIITKLAKTAKNFKQSQLEKILKLCVEADYMMKSSSEDSREILRNFYVNLAVETKR